MKNQTTSLSTGPAAVAANFARSWVTSIIAVLAVSASTCGWAQSPLDPLMCDAAPLKAGDIVYCDSGNAIQGGFLLKIDAATGEQCIVAYGGLLRMPFAAVVDEDGQIIVSDSGRLIRIDPATRTQTLMQDGSNPKLGYCLGIALDQRSGGVYVANARDLVRVNPSTAETTVISEGGSFQSPLGVVTGPNHQLYVLNRGWPSEILRVNPQNGQQTVISRGGYLNAPQSLVVSGHYLYVTDVATPDGNFGEGRIIRVNLNNGQQTIVAEGEHLVGPVGITVNTDGVLIVGDPYTINPDTREFDGGIIAIDPETRKQRVVARGHAGFVNPRGVAVMRGASLGQPTRGNRD